jgi:hypothetical protein
MNNLAITPYICLHALQIQNVKRDIVKKANIENLNEGTKQEIIEQSHETSNNTTNNTTNIDDLTNEHNSIQ